MLPNLIYIVMKKKTFIICASVLLMALIMSSCSRECECVLYENGVVIGTSTETAWGQKCDEYSSVMDTPDGKIGMECVKKK